MPSVGYDDGTGVVTVALGGLKGAFDADLQGGELLDDLGDGVDHLGVGEQAVGDGGDDVEGALKQLPGVGAVVLPRSEHALDAVPLGGRERRRRRRGGGRGGPGSRKQKIPESPYSLNLTLQPAAAIIISTLLWIFYY